jgi:hypothetical protein
MRPLYSSGINQGSYEAMYQIAQFVTHRRPPVDITPAKAGVQGKRRVLQPWIPAFAGMTRSR